MFDSGEYMDVEEADVLIVGGGFYGAYIAHYFGRQGARVILCEKEGELMSRASFANQARVHNGYHYPRSVLTALRSRISFPKFSDEFSACIDDSFDKYYLIGKQLSKITTPQFKNFCDRIGAPYEIADKKVNALFSNKFVDSAFKVKEYTFNSVMLKNIMLTRLYDEKVNIKFNSEVMCVESFGLGKLETTIQTNSGELLKIKSKQVFNCTYSMINSINRASNVGVIPFKYEMTEMCLVDIPDEIKNMSFTLMCGPYFSLMPFPSTSHYTMSHVRYTPHYNWKDEADESRIDAYTQLYSIKHKTAWRKMQKDAARYIPILSECKYISSIWEVKTILPSSEVSDSRPILYMKDHGLNGYHCVLGGKIDNVYDVIDQIE